MEACLAVLSNFSIQTSNFLPPLSCRWRPDQHPCCPSLTIGGIHDRRLQFCTLLTDQQPKMRLASGNLCNCGLRCGGDRRYPFVGSHHVAAYSARRHVEYSSRTLCIQSIPYTNITRGVLATPEETYRLRSLWQTGDFIRWLAPSDSLHSAFPESLDEPFTRTFGGSKSLNR